MKKAAPAKTKAPKRVPLASRETTKDIEDQSVAKVVSAPVEDESKENAPLQGFVDDPDVTHDIDEEEVDHKTVEMVSNWQAKTLGTPPQPSRRLPFSSSLPPSSPLPPMSEISAFSPPSPQQERNLVDPDMSYDSVASDDFGFFAAQRKIHAKRDREHNLNTASQMTQPRGRVSDAFDTSMEASFSGRPAFATPHVRRQARSTPSSQHGEDTTLELEEGSSPAVGTKRPRRSRGSSQAKAPSVHEDDETEEKVMAPRRRPKRAVLPPIVPLGKGKGKASTSRKTSDSKKASDTRKMSGSRKTSGSSAGGKSRGKRAVKGAGDEEEIDLGGVGSDDSVRSVPKASKTRKQF